MAPTAILPQPPWVSPLPEVGGMWRAQRSVLDFVRSSGAAAASLGTLLCALHAARTPQPPDMGHRPGHTDESVPSTRAET